MKGLHAGIYESKEIGNHSNNGISSKFKSVTIVGDEIPEILEADKDSPAVKIVKQNICGEYIYAEPIGGKRINEIGWMDGGSFIYSSDWRFPGDYPISLHDRQESPELNEILST